MSSAVKMSSKMQTENTISLAKCRSLVTLIRVLSGEWYGRKFHQSGLGRERELKKWRKGILTTFSKSFAMKGSREVGLYLEGARSKDSLLV